MADINFSQLTSASVMGASDQLLIRRNNALSGSAGFARATTVTVERGLGVYSTVQSSSANWTQTLAFDSGNAQLTISNGNTISLSALSASPGGSTREVNTDTTLTNTDLVVLVNASSNDVTLTLPKASLHVGKVLYIRVIGTDGGNNTVTLTRNLTDNNINENATPVSSTNSAKSWVLVAGAVNWFTVVG